MKAALFAVGSNDLFGCRRDCTTRPALTTLSGMTQLSPRPAGSTTKRGGLTLKRSIQLKEREAARGELAISLRLSF